jgi:hypothetical protein
MTPRFSRLIAVTLVVAVMFVSTATFTQAVWAEDTGSGGGGISQQDTLTQLTQTVQQLTQQVQQVVQLIGNVYQRATGGIFGSGGGTSLFSASSWLAQLQQWLTSTLNQTTGSVWSEWGSEWGQAPDYGYSTGTIAQELQQIASTLPSSVSQWVTTLAARLQTAPAPQPGTPQASATQLAQQEPTFAARTHAVQQSQVGATAAQATAQAAAEQAQQVAQQATQDQTPQAEASASGAAAQDAQAALQGAPSTRAAVEVMGAALTQQQSQLAQQNAAMAARLDALLTQQAQVALILSQTVAAAGTATGVVAQQLEQQLEDQAQAAASEQQSQVGATGGIASELQYLNQAPQDGTLDKFLTDLGQLR